MGEYIGLDVSLKETAVSVRRDGKRVWRIFLKMKYMNQG